MEHEKEKILSDLMFKKSRNSLTIVFTKNFEHKTFSQNPESEILVNYLRRNFPGANYHSVYEAGYCDLTVSEVLPKVSKAGR